MAKPKAKKAPQAIAALATITPRLFTVKQVAAYLNCAVWAVRELHWNGKVRGITVGRKLLFDRADLDKYIDQLKKAA